MRASRKNLANAAGPVLPVGGGEMDERILRERRAGILRDLSARIGAAESVKSACANAGQTIEKHDEDIPFALVYLIDADGVHARLAGVAGVTAGQELSPEIVDLSGTTTDGWPLVEAKRT